MGKRTLCEVKLWQFLGGFEQLFPSVVTYFYWVNWVGLAFFWLN